MGKERNIGDMKKNKEDIIQFWIWLRNGFAFCTSWFLLLLVLFAGSRGVESISVELLGKMMLFVAGGVLLFCIAFTRGLIKCQSFTLRLTCFMVCISVYECFAFYSMGFWETKGSAIQWLGFVGFVLGLYFLCMGIYQRYSKKQGELYTRALQEYQLKRGEK